MTGTWRPHLSLVWDSKIRHLLRVTSRLRYADLQGSVAPPAPPGAYWFQSDTTSRAQMVEVRVTNGQVTAW